MDLVALLLACSLYPDDALVRALINVHSQGNQFFVADGYARVLIDEYPTTQPAADAMLAKIQQQNGRPIVGLVAVPADAAAAYGHTTDQLFDPCTNIEVATAILSAFADECTGRPTPRSAKTRPKKKNPTSVSTTQPARNCIIKKYAQTLGFKAANYTQNFQDAVQISLQRLKSEPPPNPSAPLPPSPETSSITDENPSTNWSDERLFLRQPSADKTPSPLPATAPPIPDTPPVEDRWIPATPTTDEPPSER